MPITCELSPELQTLADAFPQTQVWGKACSILADPIIGRGEFVTRHEMMMVFQDTPLQDGDFALREHRRNPKLPLSPYNLNFRDLPADLLDQCATALVGLELPRAQVCAGIPGSGLKLADAFSKLTKIPEEKHSGIRNIDLFTKIQLGHDDTKLVVNYHALGGNRQKLLLIDDVLSDGTTKQDAIQGATAAGYDPIGVIVIVDREQTGHQILEELDIPVFSVFTTSTLASRYHQVGLMSDDRYKAITDFVGLYR